MSTSTWPKKGELLYTEEEFTKLEAEIERLRKELASYRKGECRRKIDKAMEGK